MSFFYFASVDYLARHVVPCEKDCPLGPFWNRELGNLFHFPRRFSTINRRKNRRNTYEIMCSDYFWFGYFCYSPVKKDHLRDPCFAHIVQDCSNEKVQGKADDGYPHFDSPLADVVELIRNRVFFFFCYYRSFLFNRIENIALSALTINK